MRKVAFFLMVLSVVILFPSSAAADSYTFGLPVLGNHDLTLAERSYEFTIVVNTQSGNYAGPVQDLKLAVKGHWSNGKATETATFYVSNQPWATVVKTANCVKDPWIDPAPIFSNLQVNQGQVPSQIADLAAAYVALPNMKSTQILSVTKDMLKQGLAKKPPVILKPASDDQSFSAFSPIHITVLINPDYGASVSYEYRKNAQSAFESYWPPDGKNNVVNGSLMSYDVEFYAAGEWRFRARTNFMDAQYGEYRMVIITPKKPVITQPQNNAGYLMLKDGSSKMAQVPIKIEHSLNDTISIEVQYRKDATSDWDNVKGSDMLRQTTTSGSQTSGQLVFYKSGEFRFRAYSNAVKDFSDWCAIKVSDIKINIQPQF